MIHNTVCGLLLRESKIYREIAVVNMWWMNIIVVALLALGIFGFVSLVRLLAQRLTSETTRRAEDMYDLYADSPRKRHRRSLASRRCCPVVRCPALNPVTGSRINRWVPPSCRCDDRLPHPLCPYGAASGRSERIAI